MGHWEVGDWTEVGKIMEEGPIGGPQGVVYKVGVLLVETERDPIKPFYFCIYCLPGK